MPDDPNVPGGTGGEPAAPVAPSSQSDADLLASLEAGKGDDKPDPNAEVWERVRKGEIDISKAPEDVRAMVEKPFLSLSSKKIEEANQEKQRVLSILEKIAAAKQAPPGEPPVDTRAVLREKFEQGDYDSVADMLRSEMYQEIAPQLDQLAQRAAIEQAVAFRPEISDPAIQQDVAAVFQQNPILARYSAVNKRELAPYLLAGAAAQAMIPRLQQENQQLKASIDAKVKEGIEKFKAELRGLPTSTSQAGRTPTGFPPDKPLTLDEIRDKAWAEAGGS